MAVSLKKRPVATKAPQATKAPKTKSGGTQAPAYTAGGYKTGVSAGAPPPKYKRSIDPGMIASSGAPGAGGSGPAGPATAAGPPPESAQRIRERDEEKYGYGEAERARNYGLYQAALKYGDPAVIALYGPSTDPETGDLQQIAKKEKSAQRENTLAHNANNTFFSGMNLDDMGLINTQAREDRTRAYEEFQKSWHDLEEAWQRAMKEHTWKGEGFDEGAQRELQETEPTAQAGGGGAAGGSSGGSGGGSKGGNKGKGGGGGGGSKGNGGTTAPKKGSSGPTTGVSQQQALKKKKK